MIFWYILIDFPGSVLGLIKANSAVRQNTCIEVHSLIRDCSLSLHYHDAFALEPDELGCTSAIEYKIRLSDDEPFKE